MNHPSTADREEPDVDSVYPSFPTKGADRCLDTVPMDIDAQKIRDWRSKINGDFSGATAGDYSNLNDEANYSEASPS